MCTPSYFNVFQQNSCSIGGVAPNVQFRGVAKAVAAVFHEEGRVMTSGDVFFPWSFRSRLANHWNSKRSKPLELLLKSRLLSPDYVFWGMGWNDGFYMFLLLVPSQIRSPKKIQAQHSDSIARQAERGRAARSDGGGDDLWQRSAHGEWQETGTHAAGAGS